MEEKCFLVLHCYYCCGMKHTIVLVVLSHIKCYQGLLHWPNTDNHANEIPPPRCTTSPHHRARWFRFFPIIYICLYGWHKYLVSQ